MSANLVYKMLSAYTKVKLTKKTLLHEVGYVRSRKIAAGVCLQYV